MGLFDAISDALLRMARQVVDQVLSQLTQQLNVVQEQALHPMQAMIQEVTNGIWIGEGANAFVEDVSNIMIPGVGQVSQHITQMSTNIGHARDVIDQADAQVDQLIKGRLFDQFSFF